ncbi:MAG: helix-turn-helix transcriptional regulator [Clostridia bacterium]|nr:helix-turn-helix transcriptional regulator [Clostridia bacterium]
MENHIVLPHDHGKGINHILEKMPSNEVFSNVADVFGLINDATRLKILVLLFHSEECVCNIAAAIDMSAPAVSHHLRVLRQAGIIRARRDGKETYYTLADTNIAHLLHHAVDDMFDIKCEECTRK